jgi:predicted nucleic acid-binding protein
MGTGEASLGRGTRPKARGLLGRLIVLLDSGPLWRLCSAQLSDENQRCARWLLDLLMRGHRVTIPEIVDYEIRREALRARNLRALTRLDELGQSLGYAAVTTDVMRRAAEFWASARERGFPTGPEAGLDVDVILAAQAAGTTDPSEGTVVATENPRHIALFVPALHWHDVD